MQNYLHQAITPYVIDYRIYPALVSANQVLVSCFRVVLLFLSTSTAEHRSKVHINHIGSHGNWHVSMIPDDRLSLRVHIRSGIDERPCRAISAPSMPNMICHTFAWTFGGVYR